MSEDVILGFRPHTYWTPVVAVAGGRDGPRILVRERIVFAVGAERGVYHQAAEVSADVAQSLIASVRTAVQANAKAGVARLMESLARDGFAPTIAVAPTGGKRIPERLADIVRSHTLQHAAEGEFYRDLVAAACGELGLEVRRPVESELIPLACDRLNLDRPTLSAKFKAMGAALGPPWSEDQRLAALAAWIEL